MLFNFKNWKKKDVVIPKQIKKKVYYSVQVGAFKKIPLNSFLANSKLFFKKIDQYKKYYYGKYTSKIMAERERSQLIKKGFSDAFIVKLKLD